MAQPLLLPLLRTKGYGIRNKMGCLYWPSDLSFHMQTFGRHDHLHLHTNIMSDLFCYIIHVPQHALEKKIECGIHVFNIHGARNGIQKILVNS